MASGIVVPALGVALTGHLLRKLLGRWWCGRFGGLESLVSYSSRLIAAARAIESVRPDAFVVDPLAYILAGPKAMSEHKKEQELASTTAATDTSSSDNSQQQQASSQSPVDHHAQHPAAQHQQQLGQAGSSSQSGSSIPQAVDHSSKADIKTPSALLDASQSTQQQQQMQRPIPRLIMRTVFFDDAVLAAVGSPAERMMGVLGPVLQQRKQQGLPLCKQVVLLGSGMDSRPWRLDLPPNIQWFEVDRHDVLKAKQHELQKSGVHFQTESTRSSSTSADQRTNCDSYVATGTDAASSRNKASNRQIYLKAASWNCAAVDLQVCGWSKDLVKAGFDPQEPTVWVAEGLMYYLDPECVANMLQEVASISAPGSTLALNFLLESGFRRLLDRSAASQNEHAQTTSSAVREANGQPSSFNFAEGTPNIISDGKDSSNIVGRKKSSLLSQFRWACPDDSKQFFAQQGWDMLVCMPWTQAAHEYGWRPLQSAKLAGRPPSHEVHFAVCLRL